MANSRTTPHDLRPDRDVDSNLAYLPTAEQIAAECRRIQAEWSLDEKRKRTAGVTAADDWELQGRHVVVTERHDSDLADSEIP